MTDPRRVACRYLQRRTARRLALGPGQVDQRTTDSLRQAKLKAKNDGSLNSAVISAGYYARKYDKTMYVYGGNAFGRAAYRVAWDPREYLDPINNTGNAALSVTPDLTVSYHNVQGR